MGRERGAVNPGARRRPGRVRRWLLRPLLWVSAFLAIALLLTVVGLQSRYVAERARDSAEAYLEARLGREVEIAEARLELLPPAVEARGVTIHGEQPGDPPFATAERILIEARFHRWSSPDVELGRLEVEGASVAIEFDESGGHNVPRWRRRAVVGLVRQVDVSIGRIEVRDSELRVNDHKLPLHFSARDLTARLEGGEELSLVGRVTSQDVELLLPNARPYLGSVMLDGRLAPGVVEIRRGRVQGPFLKGSLHGSWHYREAGRLDLEISADGQTRLLDSLGYLEGLASGPFRFNGRLVREAGRWRLTGEALSEAMVVLDRRLAAVTLAVDADAEQLSLGIRRAAYGGGGVTGTVRAALPGGNEAPVDVSLQFNGVGLERILRDQRIPIQGVVGEVTGPFTYRFARSRPRGGDGWANFTIESSAEVGTSRLAVAGDAPLQIQDGVVSGRAIRVTGPGQKLLAEGSYDLDAQSGAFDFSVATEQIRPLLELFPNEVISGLWSPTEGSGSLGGTLRLGRATSTDLYFELKDVVAQGYSASRLNGRLTLAETGVSELRLEFAEPDAAMVVSGAIPFEGAAGADADGIRLAIDAVGWPLDNVRAWLPWQWPFDGRFTGGVELRGKPEKLAGAIRGEFAQANWGGMGIGVLRVDAGFDPQGIAVNESELEIADGALSVVGDIPFNETPLSLKIDSQPFSLAEFVRAAGLPVAIEGSAWADGELTGSLNAPQFQVNVGLRDVTIDGEPLPDHAPQGFDLRWDGRELMVEGGLAGLLVASGKGELSSDSLDLRFDVETEHLGRFAQLVAPEEIGRGVEGSLAGEITVQASDSAASSWQIGLRGDRLHLARGEFHLENLEPVEVRFEDGVLRVGSLYLGAVDSEAEAFLFGDIDLRGDQPLELRLQASLASDWFEPWLPLDRFAGGVFDVIGKIGGTIGDPSFDGVGELRDTQVVVADLPNTLEEVGSLLLFYPDRMVIDRAVAGFGGGRLQGSGSILLPTGSEPLGYDLQLGAEEVGLRYPEGWLVRGNGNVGVISVDGGREISGSLELQRALYVEDLPVGLEQLLRLLFARRRLEVADTDPWRTETRLNLQVRSADGVRIRNNLADLSGRADLVLRGSLARPIVFGQVQLDAGGRLVYGGQQFALRQGLLTFTNPYRIEPVVDIVADAALREYDVSLSLAGTPERLRVDLASDPPLADLEVLALLTGTRDPRRVTLAGAEDSEGDGAAEGLIYSQATAAIASRFNRLFGLDQFRIDPLTSSSGDLSSARVTVGKQLSRDLFATYSYDPSQTEEQILELEWRINRSLLLVLTQNGDGTYAVDARWQRAF